MDERKNPGNNGEDKKYNLDEFDSDYIIPTGNEYSEQDRFDKLDYGDDFDFQTGEDNSAYSYTLDDDNDEDYTTTSTFSGKRKPVKKSRGSRNAAIVFTVLAIICLIAAIIFALTQCTGTSKTALIASTEASTTAATTEAEQTEEQYEPQTEAESQTEPEAQTEPQTQAPQTTEALQTSQPEPETSSEVLEQTTVSSDVSSEAPTYDESAENGEDTD